MHMAMHECLSVTAPGQLPLWQADYHDVQHSLDCWPLCRVQEHATSGWCFPELPLSQLP